MTNNNVEPISPDEAGKTKEDIFPPAVIEAFNELIAQDYVDGSSTVFQSDVVSLMMKKGLKRADIYAKGYLNIEDLYRAKGWRVSYDKPGYNENYDPSFLFRKNKR